ncbi:MAG: FtsX-like permease family protein [Oscillospiraceae bacterium]|jgi:putative ABC transport system permease protein|nr:FtsX-like permease family protein [Oscillospiraceae bacterium]
MSFAKRAVLYVVRHKTKSLILLLVLTLISTFVLTGIAIQNSAKDAAKDVRASVSGKIKLAIDMSAKNMKQGGRTGYGGTYVYAGDVITKEMLSALMAIPGVTDYNTESVSFGGSGVDFKYIPAQFAFQGDLAMMVVTLFSEKCSGFTNGRLTLKEGRHIVDTDNHVIMISNELAEYNHLKIGDTMTINSPDAKRDVSFTIVGIFTGTEGLGGNAITASQIPSNQGIIDYGAMIDEFGDDFSRGYDYIDLYVEDPINIENVYNDIANHSMIKGKTLKLSIDSQQYEVIANPLESLQSLVTTLILIISAVSVAILALLLTIWTRGRVKETGILLSIGIKKPQIIGQFILESVLIALLAFGLSYPASHAIAGESGRFIMAQVAGAQNLSDDEVPSLSGSFSASDFHVLPSSPSADQSTQAIDVTIASDDLIGVYIIGMLLTICAVLIASYTIIRLKPREILAKMS